MLSLKYIRENSDSVQKSISKKQSDIDIEKLLSLDRNRRNYLQEVELLRAQKNTASNRIAELKKNGKDASLEMISMRSVSEKIKEIETDLKDVEDNIQDKIYYIPNMVHSSVPNGKGSEENQQVREWGRKPEFSFKLMDHIEIGDSLGLFDFPRAVKMAGSRLLKQLILMDGVMVLIY